MAGTSITTQYLAVFLREPQPSSFPRSGCMGEAWLSVQVVRVDFNRRLLNTHPGTDTNQQGSIAIRGDIVENVWNAELEP